MERGQERLVGINLQGFRRRQHRDVQVYPFELGYREWCEAEAAEGRRFRIVCDVSSHFVLCSKRANAAPKAPVEGISSNFEVYEIREGDQARREKKPNPCSVQHRWNPSGQG